MTDDEIERAYADGQKAWADGADMPDMPETVEITRDWLMWSGFMVARARDFFRRRDMALHPDRVEPRP